MPTGNQTVAGSATVTTPSQSSMVVNQASQNVIINWQGFGIAAGESVVFRQPNASSVALNRVLGNTSSDIYGRLSANGQLFLVNPNGILFGPSASVDVGGLVASTLGISNADFMAGRFQFANGGKAGNIRNFGQITANNGGYIALVAPDINNAGTITANGGSVALAAGDKVTLDFFGDNLLKVKVDASALNAHIENGGAIVADGGSVLLSARAADQLVGSAINNSGIIRARSLADKNGAIVLDGGSVGSVTVSGALDVAGAEANASGGSIGVFGRDIALTGATLDASGNKGGGSVRVGGDFHGAPMQAAGNPVANARSVSVDAGSVINADAIIQGNGGKVVLWSELSTRFDGGISARGGASSGDGGSVETSGHILSVTGSVATGAPAGRGGNWLLDPWDVTIQASGGDTNTGGSPDFIASGTGSIVTTGSIQTALSGGSDVQVTTGAGGGENGDITVASPITWTTNKTLTLTAARNITVNANISASGNSAGLVLTPSGGSYSLGNGSRIDLAGSAPSLNIAGTSYTVINSLGAAGSVTGTDLQGMRGSLAGNYALGSNIDATLTSGWQDSGVGAIVGFLPVGNNGTKFSGKFDGLGHTISNLFINRPSTMYVGLFGFIDPTPTVNNVGLVGGSITGSDYTGALAGKSNGATINKSFATSNVTGGATVGGLVGYAHNGIISNAYASGNVVGGSSVGGLVGNADGFGSISNSYASGNVVGTSNFVGGLVGYLSSASCSNVYATGNVTGSFYAGGLVGYAASATITNAYSSGAVTGTLFSGGFIGTKTLGSVTSGYWDNSINSAVALDNGVGTKKSTLELKTSTLGGFVYSTTPGATGNNWVIVNADGKLNNLGTPTAAGATYPMLASEYSSNINNAHQLQLMSMALGASYTLGGNIDAAKTNAADVWGTGGFVPVGNSTTKFTGSLNGQSHTISGLTINQPTVSYMGLFGYIGGAGTVSNVGLVGGSVTGGSYSGGLAGQSDGTISSSYNTGSVTAGAAMPSAVGGLVGGNAGTISSSYATGNVGYSGGNFLTTYFGGLVGYDSGTISQSYATGNVSGMTAAGPNSGFGGLVGGSSGSYTDVYASGSVSGYSAVGGLIGSLDGTGGGAHGVITNGYASGFLTGINGVPGGLVGARANVNAITVNNSFWDSTTTGANTTTDNKGTSKATGLMMAGATFSGATWSLPGIWNIVEGKSYPYLTSIFTSAPQIVSGTFGAAGGKTIQAVANGSAIASVSTGANGFYYFALPNNTVGNGSTVLTYVSSGGAGASAWGSTGTNITGLDITASTLSVMGGSVANSSLATARGALTSTDMLYSYSGNNLTLSAATAFQTAAAASYTLDGNITTTGNQTYASPATLGQDTSLSAGTGAIAINGALAGAAHALTLSTTGAISQSAAITNVSTLTAAGSSVTLNNIGNTITNLGATSSSAGLINIFDSAGGLTVTGNVSATGGDITLATSGALAINSAVNANNNALNLTATGGAITQSAAITNVGTLTATGASVTLTTGGNTITNLGATSSTAGLINIADSAGGLTVTGNVGATGGAVTLSTVGDLAVNGTINSGANAMLLTASGNVALGNTLSAGAANDAIVLAAGGNFSNSVGAGVLSTPGGRWLVYSTNPASDTRNGLAYGFKQYNATYGVTPVADATHNGYLYTLAPGVTASLIAGGAAPSKVYDGATSATLVGANYSVSGAVDGDTVTTTHPAAGSYDDKNVAGSPTKTVTANGVAIASASNGAATVYGYQMASTDATGNIGSITKADLTLAGSRTYDGTKVVAGAVLTATGVAGETFAMGGAGDATNLASKDVQVGSLLATVTGLSLGASGNGGLAGNYNGISTVGSSVTITKADLTLAGARTYDGTTVMPGAALTATGVAGETFAVGGAGDASNLASKHVQVGSTLASVTGLSLGASGNGGLAGNYNGISTVGSSIDITKAAAFTVTAGSTSKTYGDTVNFAGSEFTTSGLQNGETVGSVTLTSAGAVNTANVAGSPYAITPSAAAGGTFSASDYQPINYVTGALTVGKATATLTASKTYDGSVNFAANKITVSGVNGETLALSAGGPAIANSKDVANNGANYLTGMGGMTLSDGTGTASNYQFPSLAARSANNQATVVAAGLNLLDYTGAKTFDGNANFAYTQLAIAPASILGTDDVSLASGAVSVASKNAGHYVAFTANTLGLGGSDAGNYSAVGGAVSVDINAKPVTLTAPVVSKTYDGLLTYTASPADRAALAAGLVGGDTVSAATIAYANKNFGAGNKVVTLDAATISDGNGGANYSVTLAGNATSTINKAGLTITAQTNTKTYDGTNTAAALPTVAGLQPGDTVTGKAETYDNANAGTGKTLTVSAYTVNDGNGGANYTVSTVTDTTGIINAAVVVPGVTALASGISAANKVYDGTTAASITSRSLTGVVGNDDVSLVGGTANFDNKNVGIGKLVTATGLSLSGAAAGNYTASSTATATADISAKAVTVSNLAAADKVYDATTAATLTGGSLVGIVGNDAVSFAVSNGAFADKNVGKSKSVSVSGSAISGFDAGNYILSVPTGLTASITPRGISLAADDKTKVVGAADPKLTYKVTNGGLLAGDALNGALTRAAGETVSAYAITQGGLINANYAISFKDGMMTISPISTVPVVPIPVPVPVPVVAASVSSPAILPVNPFLESKGKEDSFLLKPYPSYRADMREEAISEQTLKKTFYEARDISKLPMQDSLETEH